MADLVITMGMMEDVTIETTGTTDEKGYRLWTYINQDQVLSYLIISASLPFSHYHFQLDYYQFNVQIHNLVSDINIKSLYG